MLGTKCKSEGLTSAFSGADMARINKATVLLEVADAARRVHFVSQDPPVIKAAKQAGQDLAQAGRSCAAFGGEVAASWRRAA